MACETTARMARGGRQEGGVTFCGMVVFSFWAVEFTIFNVLRLALRLGTGTKHLRVANRLKAGLNAACIGDRSTAHAHDIAARRKRSPLPRDASSEKDAPTLQRIVSVVLIPRSVA